MNTFPTLLRRARAARRTGTGPVKWCGSCSRRHGSRVACDLIRVAVEAKSGRMVWRLIHPERNA
jgi:hypothetical protein